MLKNSIFGISIRWRLEVTVDILVNQVQNKNAISKHSWKFLLAIYTSFLKLSPIKIDFKNRKQAKTSDRKCIF